MIDGLLGINVEIQSVSETMLKKAKQIQNIGNILHHICKFDTSLAKPFSPVLSLEKTTTKEFRFSPFLQ